MFSPPMTRNLMASLCATVLFSAAPAFAQENANAPFKIDFGSALRDRMFWNLQVVTAKVKTKSEEPRDITGPVVTIKDLNDYLNYEFLDPNGGFGKGDVELDAKLLQYDQAVQELVNGIFQDSPELFPADATLADLNAFTGGRYAGQYGYLGTPKGIKAKAGDPNATLALSVGYYLDDGHHWAVEALVLGAPVTSSVYGAGTNARGEPTSMSGKELLTTKMLSPIVKFGYNFGDRSWPVRPYIGLGAMYAIFFDSKATSYFDQYQGGKTSVSLKNAFGVGPFVGLSAGNLAGSPWNVGLTVGQVKLKTEATLVTRGTMITSQSGATKDYGPNVNTAITTSESLYAVPFPSRYPNGFTTELIKDLAAYKASPAGGGRGDGTLGTFVRKQRTTLDTTIISLSVGRAF